MGHSLSLAFYMMYSRYAEGWLRRKHTKRLAIAVNAPDQYSTPRPNGHLIWVHASSVSGTYSILDLCRRLTEEQLNLTCLITTETDEAAASIAGQLPDKIIHQFLPTGSTDKIDAFLKHWMPDLAVWTENSLLPAFAVSTKHHNIPMVFINASMATQKYRQWRIFGGMSASVLRRFDKMQAQDDTSKKYYQCLGMPADRIEVTGGLLEGAKTPKHDEMERKALARTINGRATWLAVSVHEDEIEPILTAHQIARRSYPELLLILVPRDVNLGNKTAALASNIGFTSAQRSNSQELNGRTDVYIADTHGEMGLWYRLAPVSFIGGSLSTAGGHTPYDAANLGSAIIHGPEIHHFADAYDHLSDFNASICVENADALAAKLEHALIPEHTAQLATAAWEACSNGSTTSDKAVELIQSYLTKEAN